MGEYGGTGAGPSLLAVLAHPDDESFLIGGVLRKYASKGVCTHLLCLTSGEGGMRGEPPVISPADLPQVRCAELRRACGILGVGSLHLPCFPDGRLRETGVEVLAAKISRLVRELSPQIIITFEPEGVGNNPDHIATSLAVTAAFRDSQEAARRQGGFLPPTRLFYVVVPQSEAHLLGRDIHTVADADVEVTVDIAAEWQYKRAALLCHKSQARDIREVFGADFRGLSKREHFIGFPPGRRRGEWPFRDLFEWAAANDQ